MCGARQQRVHHDGRQGSGAPDDNDGYGQAFAAFEYASARIRFRLRFAATRPGQPWA
jgi:hypothetical protein